MPSLSGKSALVVGANQSRRLEVLGRLRAMRAVVVEAMTVPQAEAAMRQLRFELIFVDFLGAGVGILGFLEKLRAKNAEAAVYVIGPPVDRHLCEELQSPGFTKLGFGETPDSIGEVISSVLEEAAAREYAGGSSPITARSAPTKSNGRQK